MHLKCSMYENVFHINSVPGEVGNLVCAVSSSASELSFSWDLPTLLGSEVVSYQVIVNRLEHRPGTREVIQSAVDEQFVESLDAHVTGLGTNEHNHKRQYFYKVLNLCSY